MRAHQNTWGRVSQAPKGSFGIWKMVQAGMPMDV